MADISNTEYITINKNGVFVGGKSTSLYRGKEIYFLNVVKILFAEIQKQNPKVQELHIGKFKSGGDFAVPGNPSCGVENNTWCRVKLINGDLGPWVFFDTNASVSFIAIDCVSHVRYKLPELLNQPNKKETNTENKSEGQYKKSVIKAGNIRITIERIR